MTLHRMVNGVQVDLTPAEEADLLAERAANQAALAAIAIDPLQIRIKAITDLGDYTVYTATNGSGSYEAAVADILNNHPIAGA